MLLFSLVPITFQAILSLVHLVTPTLVDAVGADAIYSMLGGGKVIGTVLVIMLILALLLSIMTSMAG
ncbi:MAG: hypothetical protein H7Z18_11960 [Methylophilaceae bacterium]|nr:hypothetical protein [Methylophilaceae bacterium]